MELGLFDEVGDAVRGLMPPELGLVRFKAHRYGVKLWFDTDVAPRAHYEAQVIAPRHVPDATVLALEIGCQQPAHRLTDFVEQAELHGRELALSVRGGARRSR